MKTIVMYYEHCGRELKMLQLIKEEIEKDINVKAYILSYPFQKIEGIKLANKEHVDVVMIPFAYTSDNLDFYRIFIKNNPKTIIINFHHEEVGLYFRKIHLLPRDNQTKNGVIHLAWTKWFKDELVKCGVHPELVYITGNVRNDLAMESNVTREQLAMKYKLDIQKKWLLYAEDRVIGVDNQFFDLTNKMDIKFIEYHDNSYYETIKQIQGLNDEFFSNFELIYRAHPGSTNPVIDSKRIHQITDYTIYDWINCIDGIIVYGSTTALEADMYGVPVIVHNPVNTPKELMVVGTDKYYSVIDLNSLCPEIISAAASYGKLDIYKKYMGVNDGKNVKRVAEVIHKLLLDGNEHIQKIPTDNKFGYYFKRLIRGYILRLYLKSALFDIIKKPKVFYLNKREIPFLEQR